MKPEWQSLMHDWEETERQLRCLPDTGSERSKLEQRLAMLKGSIDAFVHDHQKRRQPAAGELTAVAIKPIR